MLPAMVDGSSPIVQRLKASNKKIRGVEPRVEYRPGAFDAGCLCALNIPTVMWGAKGGAGVLGDDYLPLSTA